MTASDRKPFTALFLCTGNSARSIMAEAILSRDGAGKFVAYSAGSMPTGKVNPHVIDLLASKGIAAAGFRSKSWQEFSGPDAPTLDFVFTVCDNAAGEACPIWPGRPMTAHWGIEDPAAVEGSDAEKEAAFIEALRLLRNRINAFISLPLKSIDAMALGTKLRDIGRQDGATATRDRAS